MKFSILALDRNFMNCKTTKYVDFREEGGLVKRKYNSAPPLKLDGTCAMSQVNIVL